MDYAILYNPVAGRGRARALAAETQCFLEARGHRAIEVRSERPGHVEELARAHRDTVDRILVLGGDGSLREAAAGLVGRDGTRPRPRAALGVLPMGSGNVVARELGLPLAPHAALEALERGTERPYDAGVAYVDGAPQLFLAMCGVGFDAEVAGAVDRTRRHPLGGRIYRRSGDLVYGAVGMRSMLLAKRVPLRVEADGAELCDRCAAVVVCNARIYGKGMVLTPDAVPDDGEFDVHVRRSRAPWVTAAALVSAQVRRPLPRWAAEAHRARALSIEPSEGRRVAWQLDGDPLGLTTSIRIEIRPRALALLAGAPAVDGTESGAKSPRGDT